MKPFSQSCEQNKWPILEILKIEFTRPAKLLEVGSGTGQHAVFFTQHLPHLHWTCSDLIDNHAGIQMWLDEAGQKNITGPLLLDANQVWDDELNFDILFSANTLHIMSLKSVENLIKNIGKTLNSGGKCFFYGPFMYDKQHTSQSNVHFDAWLKSRNPLSGVRDVSDLQTQFAKEHITLVNDYAMPANNRSLVWQK